MLICKTWNPNKLISCNEIAEKFSIPKELLAKSLQKGKNEIINAFKVPKEGILLMNHLIISVLWSLLKFLKDHKV